MTTHPFSLRFIFLGKPTPKRFQFTRFGRGYSAHQKLEEDLKRQAFTQLGSKDRLEGPLMLHCTFFMPVPKSWPKWKRKRLIEALSAVHHFYTPDTSNLVKLIEDVLNGIAWKDDRQVAFSTGQKIYAVDGRPRTVVEVSKLENHEEWKK